MRDLPAADDQTPADSLRADTVALPTVPGFEFLQELGRGGMGVVYRARQTTTQRLVALKLVRDSALAGPAVLGRFRIEAEAAARMRHPNIVEIVAVGEHAGQPYLAMELVEGGGLDHRLGEKALRPRDAATLIRTLADAVQHAHERHVIHRDLKPANILVIDDVIGDDAPPSTWQIKITDFGLAKRLDSDSTAWTQDGTVLGTANYMAPEQAAGQTSTVGPAVDLYSLGAILYELLTGRPPFRGDSVAETIRRILHEEPELPSKHVNGVPRELEAICLRCLEKEPGGRYASAAELRDDLDRYLTGRPIVAVVDAARRLERQAARDGYRLVAEIGRGPRSTVYQAIFEPLRQPVALKVFRDGLVDRENWEARVARSGDVLSSVSHPQVVSPHRAGWWNGAAYLAVDYAPQGSLAGRRRDSIADAVRLVAKIAEIVVYLHRQGVVHGNLKPGNVLLGADGVPRLVDFRETGGLFIGPAGFQNEDPSAVGYVAAETLDHPEATPLPNTDVYGLGLILYERLTGRPPFAGKTVDDVVRQVREQDPIPPSQFNSQVTPALEGCCLRCLRRKPASRYLRVYDLLKRLRVFENEFPDRHGHGRGSR